MGIKQDPEGAEQAGQAGLSAAEAAAQLQEMQGDDDAFEAKPKKVKERGAMNSDVHSCTVQACKPVLAQASDILVGPEYDPKQGVCLSSLGCPQGPNYCEVCLLTQCLAACIAARGHTGLASTLKRVALPYLLQDPELEGLGKACLESMQLADWHPVFTGAQLP